MASSIWSPTRSMVLYGPIFRREVGFLYLGRFLYLVPYFKVGRGPSAPGIGPIRPTLGNKLSFKRERCRGPATLMLPGGCYASFTLK